jgi:glycosyltransferase involved in cell wall biosynthesis
MTMPALTVVFATCDRAAVLSDTLTHMCGADRTGLQVDFIVVDNNSQDGTRAVVESFRDRLSIQYLHEPRRGKNRALNLALEQGTFNPLVIFTDDDVKPAQDWFRAIVAVSGRWPDHKVFGGRIVPGWPVRNPPEWALDSHISQLAFAAHDLGPVEKPYVETEQPFGPNFWLRREVLQPDVRFDDSVGPGTGSLGDEVMFLHKLQQKGFEIIYSPHAWVEHRIQPDGICEQKLKQRALMVGRIGPTMYGLCRPELLSRAPWLWKLMRHIRLNQARLHLLRAQLHPNGRHRIVGSISPLINIGYNAESLRLAGKQSAGRR